MANTRKKEVKKSKIKHHTPVSFVLEAVNPNSESNRAITKSQVTHKGTQSRKKNVARAEKNMGKKVLKHSKFEFLRGRDLEPRLRAAEKKIAAHNKKKNKKK